MQSILASWQNETNCRAGWQDGIIADRKLAVGSNQHKVEYFNRKRPTSQEQEGRSNCGQVGSSSRICRPIGERGVDLSRFYAPLLYNVSRRSPNPSPPKATRGRYGPG